MIAARGYETVNSKGVVFIRFRHFAETGVFTHSFSTRIGGVSEPPYDTLNLGFQTDDREEPLCENRRRFQSAIGLEGIPLKQIINLVHENLVLNYDELPADGTIPDADGIVTDRTNIPLVTTHADCLPVMLADPVTKAYAVIHAGWRSTFTRIAGEGVKKMIHDFGSKPENILAAIGPGIARCCFEVDKNVNDAFLDRFFYWKDLITETSNRNKWRIDLHLLNERILIESGLHKTNIITADLCTVCNKDLFFSYRRDGKASGRMTAVMARTL